MTMRVDHILKIAAAAHPQRLAVTLGEEAATFGQAGERANRFANALAGLGLRPGSRVIVNMDIALDCVFLHFALARLGAIFIPVNPNYSESELSQICAYLKAQWFIADAAHAEVMAALAKENGAHLAVLAPEDRTVPGVNLQQAARLASARVYEGPEPDPDDIQVMYMTSGSTGTPKGVMISHRASWLRAHLGTRQNAASGIALMFPLYHLAGFQMMHQAWGQRRAAHYVRRAEAEQLLGTIERWGASALYAIPAVWRRILECKTPFDTHTLVTVETGTSAVEDGLMGALRERFPKAINAVGYGSTEAGTALWLMHDDVFRKPGSVGLPMPAMETRIDDGELLLRSAMVMSGYFELPEETAENLVDGWYRTGDLAKQDDEGYFSIVGRRREVIRSGGETISPNEVELALRPLAGVRDFGIVGIPDPSWGEIVCVAYVPEPGSPAPTVEALRARLTHLAAFKHPRMILAVDAIPRTPATGQVQRRALRNVILAAKPR